MWSEYTARAENDRDGFLLSVVRSRYFFQLKSIDVEKIHLDIHIFFFFCFFPSPLHHHRFIYSLHSSKTKGWSLSLPLFHISPMIKSLNRRSTFEDLSDDILMDIFDLFNPPIYIYHSFYNINSRLNRILRDARLLISLDLSRMFHPANFAYHCQLMLPNMFKQLISLRLSNRIQLYEQIRIFLQHFHFSQFESLRQLALVQITFEQLKTSLSDIWSLTKLIHLEIDAFDGSGISSDEVQLIANTLTGRSSSIKVKTKLVRSLVRRIDSFSVSSSSIQSSSRHSRKPFAIAQTFEFVCVLFIGSSSIILQLYKSSIFDDESRTNSSSLFDLRISGSRWNDSTSTSLIDVLPSIEKILSRYQRSNVGRCQVVSLLSASTSLFISSRPFVWRRLFQRRSLAKNPRQSKEKVERISHPDLDNLVGQSSGNWGVVERIHPSDHLVVRSDTFVLGTTMVSATESRTSTESLEFVSSRPSDLVRYFRCFFSHLFPTSRFSSCIQKGSATFSSFTFQILQSEKNMSSAPLWSIDGKMTHQTSPSETTPLQHASVAPFGSPSLWDSTPIGKSLLLRLCQHEQLSPQLILADQDFRSAIRLQHGSTYRSQLQLVGTLIVDDETQRLTFVVDRLQLSDSPINELNPTNSLSPNKQLNGEFLIPIRWDNKSGPTNNSNSNLLHEGMKVRSQNPFLFTRWLFVQVDRWTMAIAVHRYPLNCINSRFFTGKCHLIYRLRSMLIFRSIYWPSKMLSNWHRSLPITSRFSRPLYWRIWAHPRATACTIINLMSAIVV